MSIIQEALRELMQRSKDARKVVKKQSITTSNEKINKNTTRAAEALLPELWDQVYSSLIDAGDNQLYDVCGGKGPYNPDQATIKNATTKYGDHIISIIYDAYKNMKSEDVFFAKAKKIAEKFGLTVSRTEKRNLVFFNIFVPQDSPVYFDLIPERYRKRIAIENGEDLDNLPTSPLFTQESLSITTVEDFSESIDNETIDDRFVEE